jgi:hypothetical protein
MTLTMPTKRIELRRMMIEWKLETIRRANKGASFYLGANRFGQMLSKPKNFLVFVSWRNPAAR